VFVAFWIQIKATISSFGSAHPRMPKEPPQQKLPSYIGKRAADFAETRPNPKPNLSPRKEKP
jgi:hypothetical protein